MNAGLIWDNLVTYSFQVGLLIGMAGFVPTLLRLRWPGARLIYWQILLAACLLLPLVRPWRQEVIAAVGMPVSTTIAIAAPSGPATRPAIPRGEVALLLLAAGALARLSWLGVGFWRLRRYRRHSQSLGIRSGCPLFLSNEVSSPVTFGWRKPVVLLPARFPELERRIQDAILCHELLHVERRDWLFTLSEEVVRAIFWFHPAIWWLLGEIQLAREQAVDSQVIERTEAREEYVDALLAIAGAKPQMDLALAPLFLRKRHLKQRVVSIFKEVRMSKTRLISRFAMGLAVLAAACWIVTGTFPLAASPQVSNDAPGVTVDIGPAALLHRSPVSYPEAARKKGVQGTVMVEATIDGSGNVADARVLSGPDELRKAALQSVLQWHFQSGAAGTTRTVSIGFQLPAGPAQGQPQNNPDALRAEQRLAQAEQMRQRSADELSRTLSTTVRTPEGASADTQVARAQALARLQEALRAYTAGGRTLKSIVVVGLSDQMRSDLLARLPLREGATLPDDWRAKMGAAVREFDEHLTVNTSSSDGDVTLTIIAPNASPEGTAGVIANGPKLVHQVAPVYPPTAKAARISGVVKFNAIITTEGTIKNLEVISGHPLLVPAAIEAVKQWVYEPTLLNGNPVEVSTQISLNFTLSE
jgi:TonB family protein